MTFQIKRLCLPYCVGFSSITHVSPLAHSTSTLVGKSIYLLENYVTCAKFSNPYCHFIAVVNTKYEPTRYFESISHLK